MKFTPLNKKSPFVLAVSAGVDSMVLLDMCRRSFEPSFFVVAHFNHQMREDAETTLDKHIVEDYCREHSIPFEYGEARQNLASEADARSARYAFLWQVASKHGLNSVATAHHKDDHIETAIINIVRGTGYRGLASLSSSDHLWRPFLGLYKYQLLDYAKQRRLRWHEDETNENAEILRNYIRLNVVNTWSNQTKNTFYEYIEKIASLHKEISAEIAEVAESITHHNSQTYHINRKEFIFLPHSVSLELWRYIYQELDIGVAPKRKNLEKQVVFMKTSRFGAYLDVSDSRKIIVDREFVKVELKS